MLPIIVKYSVKKTCVECHKEKDDFYFYPRKLPSGNQIQRSRCIECSNRARREYYHKTILLQRKIAKQWGVQNRDFIIANGANSNARMYGQSYKLSRQDIKNIFSRDASSCVYCSSTDRLGIDHVRPFNVGGLNIIGNIVVCCRLCNRSKNSSDAIHWSQFKFGKVSPIVLEIHEKMY